MHVPFPHILEFGVGAPGSDGPFIFGLEHVDEAGFAYQALHPFLDEERFAEAFAAFDDQFAHFVPHVPRLDGVVVRSGNRGDFELFKVAAGSKMAKRKLGNQFFNWTFCGGVLVGLG